MSVVYSYADSCRTQRHNDKDETVLLEKYLSLYLNGCVWEGVGDRTELQYIDPHSYGHQRCVFLVLYGCSTGGPRTHSARCRLPLPHLVTNGYGLQTDWSPELTDFLSSPNYIIVQSPTQYLPMTDHRVTSTVLGMACLIVIKRI